MNQGESYLDTNFVYISSGNRRAIIFYIGDEAYSYFKVTRSFGRHSLQTLDPLSRYLNRIPENFINISKIASLYDISHNIKFFKLTEDEFINHVVLETI